MSEPWATEFSSTAIRSLNRLPERIAAAIVEFSTGTLPNDPVRLSKPLTGELAQWRVARRGEYRIVFRLINTDGVLLIGRIDHRADVYRPR